MKAATSTINRGRRNGLKTRSASQITEPGLTREYQAIFTNNGKPMVIVEADATISIANAEFARLSGYTKEEIEGHKRWTEFVARGDRKRMREYHLLRKSDPMLAPRCCEFRFLDRHGKVTNVVLTIGQIPGTNKSMASLQDVTDRRRAEATQRVGEERYRTLFENSRDAIYITAPNGAYIDANPAALALFGYTKEAMKKVKAQQLYADPADARRLQREIEKKGFAQDFEARLRKKDGGEMDCLLAVTAQRADDGSIVEYQCIVRDITERKKEEEALRESEEKYRTILETMHDAYFEVDLAGTFTFVNDAACRHLGYTKEELIGMNNRVYTSPETAKKIYKTFNGMYKKGESTKVFDYEAIRKDGTTIMLELSASLVRDAKGKPIGFRGVSREVTERRRMEEALRQSEERYREMLASIQEGYFETDLDGNYTFVNDANCRYLGYTREELIGMNYKQHTEEKIVEKLYPHYRKLYETGKPIESLEFEAVRKDGTKVIYDTSVTLMRDSNGKPIGIRGVSRDITERKRAEEELRKSEEKYRTILENITEGYFENDLQGNFTFLNDSLLKTYGYTKDELLHMHYRQFMDEENAARVYQAYNKIYTTGKTDKEIQFEIIRKDGTRRYLENSVSLMKDANGQPIGFRGISRDITERKRAEEALRQSEERYRTILETMHDAYFELDLAGKFTFVNDAQCKMTGSPRERLIGMDNRYYTDEATAKTLYEAFNKIYSTGEPLNGFDFEHTKKDGTKAFNEISASLIRDAEGKPIGFRGIGHDITERKRAEEALRQSEEKYRTILESIEEGYFEVNLAGSFTFINDSLCRIHGHTRDELMGMNNRQYMDEETSKRVYKIFNTVFRTGKSATINDWQITRKNGSKRVLESSVLLIKDSSGNPRGFRGIVRDVTKRKQMEEALRQSEEKYRTILESIEDGYAELDLHGIITFSNDALLRILGYPEDELKNLHFKNRRYMDKENAEKVYQAYTKVYTTGKPNRGFQYEIIAQDGTRRHLESSISLKKDAGGQPVGFQGVVRDITERNQAEERLHQSEEKYRTILETMQEAYYEIDLTGHYTFVNNALCRHLGYSKEELIGIKTRQYQDETDAKKSYKAFNAIYETGEPLQAFEGEFIRKDGTKGTYELSASLIRDAEGKPIGFRGVSRDVSERKQMEEVLKLRLKQLGALSRASQVVNATLAIDDVLQEVVSLANNAVASDYTGVVLIDESGNLVRSADDVPGIPSIEHRIREKGFTHWINHSHKALIIDEIGEDGAVVSPADLDEGVPRFADINLVKAGVKSLAGLPLLAKGRLLGVLYLHGVRPNVFKGQLGLLITFANQAAIAIENARLFEEAQHELAERKRAEEHLQRYAAELERSNEEVKNFAYIVSHDLRVPLVNLKGYTSELRTALGVIGAHFDAALPHLNDEARSDVAMALHEDVPEALEFITNSVSRMDGFINAVLILSRLGRRELKSEPIDMNALVQTVLEPLSYQIQERGIAVTVDSLPEVVADRTSMEQIVGNILGNAVKYLDPDRPREIEINAERNHQETIFRIRDTGRGIAQEDMHKVFAPFRRAGKQDTPGEGMGLAYVQTLVRRHGGRIWCESEPGKGTTLTFTIANPSGKGAQDD